MLQGKFSHSRTFLFRELADVVFVQEIALVVVDAMRPLDLAFIAASYGVSIGSNGGGRQGGSCVAQRQVGRRNTPATAMHSTLHSGTRCNTERP